MGRLSRLLSGVCGARVMFLGGLLLFGTAGALSGGTAARAQTVASAQSIAGTWQGTLHLGGGHDLRTVLKITNGPLAATFFSIDQGAQGVPVSKISFEEGTLRYGITAFDLSYVGKLSADGNTFTGTSTQAGNSTPLNLDRATAATAWAMPTPPAPVKPMPADAQPSFEVATIKPSKPDQPGKMYRLEGRRFSTMNTTLLDLVTFAYGLQPKQVVNAPDWVATEKFDLSGTPDVEGAPDDAQMKGMVQRLLADRFALKFHQDPREMPAYELTVLKSGQKMEKSTAGPDSIPGLWFPKLGQLNAHDATMLDFTHLMQTAVLDRPIVDKTGLTGRWTFVLKWTPDESQFSDMGVKISPPKDAADAPPPLLTAMQEQIGLKLNATRSDVPVYVVDHVTQPSAN